ncbi:MAG: energy-coupling factor transporter transmembrane component T, partial [Clostridioides difficile]|nr:energy-coupling factor transporter transmembrane component T [Clostridioides difficile]
MLKDITIGQYLPGESFVHKLDPRTKILISLIFIICLFIVNKFIGYTVVIGFLLAVILVAKIPFRFIVKGLKPIFLLVVFTAVLNIFMIKGTPDTLLYKIGFLSIYVEGVKTAAFMAIRLILLIIGTSILTLTTSPIELTDGIEKLLRPIGKEIAHELAMMMTIALRFIPTLIDETDKIMKAQK